MESSDSIDKSWDTSSETTTTGQRSDPNASSKPTEPVPGGWMVNVAGRDIVEMSHSDVVSRRRSGELGASVLVWREGMDNWARLDSVPAFQIGTKPELATQPRPGRDEPAEDTNLVAVYERPAATLVFDEAVESDWKALPTSREASKSVRGSEPSKSARSASVRSASARPPAPSLPPLAPPRTTVVPSDEPPPPPPLPPRRSPPPPARISARPTIPGGLAAPSRPPTSASGLKTSSPPASASFSASKSGAPPSNPSSPLLAAIAAAASNPAPVVVATPVEPAPQAVVPVAPAAAVVDEVSISARLSAMKSIPLRHAVYACAGSALVASLVTGLIVGSSSRHAARRDMESPAKTAALAPQPSPPPPAPPPQAVAASKSTAEATPAVEKVALSDLDPAEKPKAKPSKAHAWKAPRTAPASESGTEADKPTSSLERDDPVRAIPDGPEDRSTSRPASWQADPGF